MQHAVDAEADDPDIPPRFNMNVRRPLIESVLPEPVNDVNDVLVVGVERPVGLAQFNQLLEARNAGVGLTLLRRLLDRFGEVEELNQITLDIRRAGHDATDVLAQDGRQFALPLAQIGLSGRDHHLVRRHLNRQDGKAGRIGAGHHVADPAEINFQRIDMHVGQTDLIRHPLRQDLDGQQAGRKFGITPFLVGNHHQRMDFLGITLALFLERCHILGDHQAIGQQQVKHLAEAQPVFGMRLVIHAWQYSTHDGPPELAERA